MLSFENISLIYSAGIRFKDTLLNTILISLAIFVLTACGPKIAPAPTQPEQSPSLSLVEPWDDEKVKAGLAAARDSARVEHLAAVAKGAKPSVLVVGAGPGGLIAALTAYRNGHDVQVAEKRDGYTREQIVRLSTDSEATLSTLLGEQTLRDFQTAGGYERGPAGVMTIKLRYLESVLAAAVGDTGVDGATSSTPGLSTYRQDVKPSMKYRTLDVFDWFPTLSFMGHPPLRKPAVIIDSSGGSGRVFDDLSESKVTSKSQARHSYPTLAMTIRRGDDADPWPSGLTFGERGKTAGTTQTKEMSYLRTLSEEEGQVWEKSDSDQRKTLAYQWLQQDLDSPQGPPGPKPALKASAVLSMGVFDNKLSASSTTAFRLRDGTPVLKIGDAAGAADPFTGLGANHAITSALAAAQHLRVAAPDDERFTSKYDDEEGARVRAMQRSSIRYKDRPPTPKVQAATSLSLPSLPGTATKPAGTPAKAAPVTLPHLAPRTRR